MLNIRLFLFLFIFLFLIFAHGSERAAGGGITFDDVSVEDYGATMEQEPTRPDDVDNEVIQSLVDEFLNKGSVGGGGEVKDKDASVTAAPVKLNKEAQALINSSDFWRTENLEPTNSISDPARTKTWLNGYSAELQRILQQIAQAGWNYFTTASYTTKQYLDETEEVGRAFLRSSAKQSMQYNASSFSIGSPERIQLSVLAQQGMNALDVNDFHEFNQVLLTINQQFTHTQLCGEPGKAPISGDKTACLLKFSDIPSVLSQSPTPNAMQCFELWQKWRLAAGKNLTASYSQLVQLSNKGARLNGFTDAGAMWRAVYELPKEYGFYFEPQLDIGQQLETIYTQLKPLYEQMHAYFRARLAAIHSKKGNEENQKAGEVTRDGPLPIHLLKSQNGDSWTSYYELTRPFADEEMPITAQQQQIIANELLSSFHAQNYTVRIMFVKVYRFMKYLGFEHLPRSFWTNSIFTRNWAKDMICNPATAYDMMNGKDDYRVKVCGQLSEQDFVNAHRLLSKLYYQYGSRRQPLLLRDAPNPSLSSALAGAFAVIALNPDYLRAQRLIGEHTERSGPAEINRLYKEAMEELVKLPFAIMADKWRYAVFEGKLNAANWSEEWWMLRYKYQGITAPALSDPKAIEFDAVASPAISQFHAPATRDAIAYVAQFQVLKKLCGGIGQISQGCLPNKNVLESVQEAISRGGSISWLDALEKLSGTRKLDAGPMLEYFEPLMEWLKNTNENEQRVIGWMANGTNGAGEPFFENELPELHNEYQNENTFGSGLGVGGGVSATDDNNVAYPGQPCNQGQECLLDTVCNGIICVCKQGLYTLKIADTYNCVPGDPAKVGFTNEDGTSIVIELNANNVTTNEGKMADSNGNNDAEKDANGDTAKMLNGQKDGAVEQPKIRNGAWRRGNGTAMYSFLHALLMLLIGSALTIC